MNWALVSSSYRDARRVSLVYASLDLGDVRTRVLYSLLVCLLVDERLLNGLVRLVKTPLRSCAPGFGLSERIALSEFVVECLRAFEIESCLRVVVIFPMLVSQASLGAA